jgi:predicted  nucleic acid-binding Zn-ribbon protein
LDLQGADTVLAQLRHRRATLPELAKIAVLAERAEASDVQRVQVHTTLQDIADDQRRLENEVDTVRTRASKDNQRMASGGAPAKELEGLQHELVSLARRQSTLEDELLEYMERREEAEQELAGIDAELAGIRAERAELEAARDASFATIDAGIAERQAVRADTATALPADLLALYEKVAAANGGVGAAMLKQRRCEGCHLELAGNELTTVRAAAPNLVVRCENCRRILIRTAESGL